MIQPENVAKQGNVDDEREANIHSARLKYEKSIISHSNYEFIPRDLTKSWVSASKSGVNPRREYWCNEHQRLIDSGKLLKGSTHTNLARYLHPTKIHTCKMCGEDCSILYVYPTKTTLKWLNKKFNIAETPGRTIFDIYRIIESPNKYQLFTDYFNMNIETLERNCNADQISSKNGKLSPGVMGNPPDRLDGFHCYNSICGCRPTRDKGRSAENMKSYTRDRRAYEQLSDGNCLLANVVMGKLNTINSRCFMCGKYEQMTADHIGPISLGFIHDPINFQACCSSCNSSKNNRMTQVDIDKIIALEETGETMISWWAKQCWDKHKRQSTPLIIKNSLDTNAKTFLIIINWLRTNKQTILNQFINDNYMNHDNAYTINDIVVSNGDITFNHTETISVKKTKQTQKDRTNTILLEINEKTNRKIKVELTETDINYLIDIEPSTFKSKICTILEGL